MSERPLLPATALTPHVASKMAQFHADVVQEVRATVGRDPVVVVGMAWNPHVKKARQNLEKAGIAFTYLEYGNYLSGWQKRLAIKMWSGWPTFPQVFVRGALIGGNKDLEAFLADGTVRQMLDKAA